MNTLWFGRFSKFGLWFFERQTTTRYLFKNREACACVMGDHMKLKLSPLLIRRKAHYNAFKTQSIVLISTKCNWDMLLIKVPWIYRRHARCDMAGSLEDMCVAGDVLLRGVNCWEFSRVIPWLQNKKIVLIDNDNH